MHRPRLTTEQRDRIISNIERLTLLAYRKHGNTVNRDTDRIDAVIKRLKWWLASHEPNSTAIAARYYCPGLCENNAQWLALYDSICAAYATWRYDTDQAFEELRWLGMNVYPDTDNFPREVELARSRNKRQMIERFNAVDWDLKHMQRKLWKSIDDADAA